MVTNSGLIRSSRISTRSTGDSARGLQQHLMRADIFDVTSLQIASGPTSFASSGVLLLLTRDENQKGKAGNLQTHFQPSYYLPGHS